MKPVTQEWLNRAKDDLDVVAEIIEIVHLTNITADYPTSNSFI